MGISIQDFKGAFNGGMRANRFSVEGIIPFSGGNLSKFHIRATQIPNLASTTVTYDYFGRKINYPGELQFTGWSVIVLDDVSENGNLWKKFNTWQNTINNHENNISTIETAENSYKAYGWKLHHLSLNGEETDPVKTFIMDGCWPKSIKEISLNMTNVNVLNAFSAVFIYDNIRVEQVT